MVIVRAAQDTMSPVRFSVGSLFLPSSVSGSLHMSRKLFLGQLNALDISSVKIVTESNQTAPHPSPIIHFFLSRVCFSLPGS